MRTSSVGTAWRRASRSKEDGSNCIEVAELSDAVAIRDSKDPGGPELIIGRGDFRDLAEALKKA
ncbi:DUF397 domain-containing protein [Actinomadura sp. NAK00032]|uniref:DUF397 domain-containing protein n=1 Tax=Actinomadura sp. NAK00032 TaxID=2742128 RepID=UPI001592A884|nr:DUF397 domain-containing protein [Actinomadura sp. NAK00032]QKW38851.1 DUF397 domain-containing protein [Actinomadura sp. NAK00032]